MRGDLGLGERRPRRHALEELAGRDGVLHRLRRGELMLNERSTSHLLGEFLEVEPFALQHLAVQLEKPRRQVAALAEDGRHVVLAYALNSLERAAPDDPRRLAHLTSWNCAWA